MLSMGALALFQGSPKPAGEELYVWLGRAYGRRAETSGPLSAPGLASRSCKYFETAVQMDILNREATGDLFDYYMGAPGFLGGGLSKAQDLTRRVSAADPAEGQHLLAVARAKKNKEYDAAEQHLRNAIQLAPKQGQPSDGAGSAHGENEAAPRGATRCSWNQAQHMARGGSRHSVLPGP